MYALAASLRAWVLGTIRSKAFKKVTLPRHARARLDSCSDAFLDVVRTCREEDYTGRPAAAEVADSWAPTPTAGLSSDEGRATEGPAGGAVALRQLEPGDRIDDRYTSLEQLGAGSTVVTFLAYEQQAERNVALKSFNVEPSAPPARPAAGGPEPA